MNRKLKKILINIILLCSLIVTNNVVKAKSVTPVEAHGALKVEGSNIVDKNGNKFQLRGVSTHGIGLTTYYHKFVNQESFDYMRDEWKINAVRLTRYTPNNDAAYVTLNREEFIKQAIEYAINSGLYVMIDWHVLKPGDPNAYKNEAIEYFKYYANLFKDYPNIIYEIANEPNDKHPEGALVNWQDSIKPYSEEVISEIRKIDDDAIIVVGTPGYSHDIHIVADDPITEYNNIVYSYHFYAASRGDSYRTRLKETIDKGLPILISECGMVSANGDGNVDYESADKWMKILDDNKIGYFVWQLTNKAEGSSLIRNDVNKYTNWTYDELSNHGKWLVDNLSKYENDNIIENPTYNYLEGAEQAYILGVNDTASFRINADYSLFENGGNVYVDNELIDSSNYISESGSTIIKLNKTYMDSLKLGNHTLTVIFNDEGIAKTTFTVSNDSYINNIETNDKAHNPSTKDNILLYILISGISLIVFIGSIICFKKIKKKI